MFFHCNNLKVFILLLIRKNLNRISLLKKEKKLYFQKLLDIKVNSFQLLVLS